MSVHFSGSTGDDSRSAALAIANKDEEENHLLLNASKSVLPASSLQVANTFVWLETADGLLQEIEQEVAMLCPLICREAVQKGKGTSRNTPIVLPPQVSSTIMNLILEYCRFHHVSGRSNKERKLFDERFIRLDTKRLCELTSAADCLQMKPLVDLTSRALARMIEGKTPEEIRETFHLPDDLTEEEKLEPLKNATDDPRIRLLNRLYARKRKELQEKEKTKSVQHEGCIDERSVEDLVSFINGGRKGMQDCKNSKGGKCKKKRNRRKKEQVKGHISEDASGNYIQINFEENDAREEKSLAETRRTSKVDFQRSEPASDEEGFTFDDGDGDDGLDPVMKEELDREVEDFARRLNSDWPERKRMQDLMAVSGQEQRQICSMSLRVASVSLVDSWCGENASKFTSRDK